MFVILLHEAEKFTTHNGAEKLLAKATIPNDAASEVCCPSLIQDVCSHRLVIVLTDQLLIELSVAHQPVQLIV